MSMNTPIGNITQTTPIKNFKELDEMQNEQYLLGIDNNTVGNGSKISLENLINSSISTDSDNLITKGTDDRLLVNTPVEIGNLSDLTTINKSTLVAAINEVDGDIGDLTDLESSDKTDIVNSINSVISDMNDKIGELSDLTTYQSNLVNAINQEVADRINADLTLQSDYNSKIGSLSNLTTTDKSSLVGAINEVNTLLPPTSQRDYIDNSKAMPSGEVSSNVLILPEIQNYAHSTFDRSKFTVVGSPNITDDGVASVFSSLNGVAIALNINDIKTLECFNRILYTATSSERIFSQFTGTSSGTSTTSPYAILTNTRFKLDVTINGTWQRIVDKALSSTLRTGDVVDIYYRLGQTSQVIKVFANGNLVLDESLTLTLSPINIVNLLPAEMSNNTVSSIDLKYLRALADGVEVFSGNKTGIDMIKPDDYIVIGTPTITADRVASGFSEDNNFVLKTLNLSNASSLRIEFANIYCPRQTTERHKAFFEIQPNSNSSSFGLRLYRNALINYGLGAIYPTSSGGATIVDLSPSLNTAENFSGYIEIKNNILSFVINDTACGSYELTTEQLAYIFTNVKLSIGAATHSGSGQYLTDGSIDLNSFKIYVDGNLVYQPCLKIPYTESKTGSKIVDSIYRDRVNDMADQFGYANYYTLSDTDFTLPQVELYGYIEKRARDIAHPVAQPFYRFSDEINEDEVRLEGAEVDKGLYLAIENDPYLSALCTAGSTSDKICLPDFRNRVIYGDVTSGYIEPELPNITGSVSRNFGYGNHLQAVCDGAFYASGNGPVENSGASGVENAAFYANFDASRSSSIYKNGGTVKTAGVKARWLCRWK